MSKYIFLISVIVALAVSVAFITLHGITLDNDQYDRLKKIVIKWSAIVTFLGVIVATFTVPYGTETITVVAAIGALLGKCLDESNANYNDGAIIHDDDEPLADDFGEAIEGGDEE